MLSTIQDLFQHKWWANAKLLHAVQQHPAACEDEELRKMLHHILVSNRFWLLTILERPFDLEVEMRVPGSFADLLKRFQETGDLEFQWLSTIGESDLEYMLPTHSSRLGLDVSVRQAILQICMHTQGHRSQCATRLRALGGIPPGTDYVLWVKEKDN